MPYQAERPRPAVPLAIFADLSYGPIVAPAGISGNLCYGLTFASSGMGFEFQDLGYGPSFSIAPGAPLIRRLCLCSCVWEGGLGGYVCIGVCGRAH